MSDLFDTIAPSAPLAERLRPQTLADVIGQDHVLGPEGVLRPMLASGQLGSLIFWGPPGVGKTTLARLLAAEVDYALEQISAIFSGVAELRKTFERAKQTARTGRRTVLFVDEIHRFNKAQQDSFLPHIEDGTIVLVGATTENPSFELNAALLSRAQVITLAALDESALGQIYARAQSFVGHAFPLTPEAQAHVIAMADGDGRALINMLEQIATWPRSEIFDIDRLSARLMRRASKYDKSGDAHYNLISALHKSVRGSDPDAALYWFARMLEGGEDPHYLARRLVRMAVEDIALADPQAQQIALATWQNYERLGSPEGELALANLVIYLALAPKSNAAYVAYKAARRAAKEGGSPLPPKHILNAPTSLMQDEGYGAGYAYDHDAPDGFSGQSYFPDGMERPTFYDPVERGFERDLRKRVAYFDKLRTERGTSE